VGSEVDLNSFDDPGARPRPARRYGVGKEKPMKTAKMAVLKYLNVIIGILILNQVLTGLLGHALRHGLFDILHKGTGIVLFVGVLLHLALNWGWVKSNFMQ
jgi:hypothetical protein